MPELPDVEVYRRIAVDTALGRPIAGVEAVQPDLLEGVTADDLRARLTGRALHETLRHGKHLFLGTGEDGWLRLHFGMSGRLVAVAPQGAPQGAQDGSQDGAEKGAMPDAADLVLRFDDGGALVYAAPRKLGAIGWVDDPAAFVRDEHLGRDAFAPRLTADALAALLADRHGMVKPALTDQHRLAGIGNVYADEALFQAGLHPRARADRLDRDQVAALADALHHVCDLAIKHGADPARLPGSWLLPHREAGAACPRCGAPLEEIKVSGRTTVFCPTCQPAG